MYRKKPATPTTISINQAYQGETIEQKVFRMMNNGEPISDKADLIYTDRKDGVNPDTDIRTDKFEYVIDAMDAASRSNTAKRDQRIGERTYDTMSPEQQEAFDKNFPKNKHKLAKDAKKAQNPGTGDSTSI